MARTGTVCDYAGDELAVGDIVAYATRCENSVRMADAEILLIERRIVERRIRPMVLLKPTGDESGIKNRRSLRTVWVAVEHVRLIVPK